ncbi:DUF1120 domain-containing protein [Pseudomonas proteolytica]|nr:DUF1120 domain-containing protein [Pseudomonas proteolytica]
MISGEGLIDFGKMSVKQLNTDAYTSLPRENLDFQVLCEGPTFFTFNTIDNRSGTSAHNEGYHGLGMTPNGEKLGGRIWYLPTGRRWREQTPHYLNGRRRDLAARLACQPPRC